MNDADLARLGSDGGDYLPYRPTIHGPTALWGSASNPAAPPLVDLSTLPATVRARLAREVRKRIARLECIQALSDDMPTFVRRDRIATTLTRLRHQLDQLERDTP